MKTRIRSTVAECIDTTIRYVQRVDFVDRHSALFHLVGALEEAGHATVAKQLEKLDGELIKAAQRFLQTREEKPA